MGVGKGLGSLAHLHDFAFSVMNLERLGQLTRNRTGIAEREDFVVPNVPEVRGEV